MAGRVDTALETQFLKRTLTQHGCRTVLDVACGNGRHAIPLAACGFSVTGIDRSPQLIAIAKRRAHESQSTARFSVTDVRDFDTDEVFDAAVIMWSSFGLLPYREALCAITLCIKPRGLLILDTREYAQLPPNGSSNRYLQTIDVAGGSITAHFNVRQSGRQRVLEVVYVLNGRRLDSVELSDILLVHEIPRLVEPYGWIHDSTSRNYGRPASHNRGVMAQFVFQKNASPSP